MEVPLSKLQQDPLLILIMGVSGSGKSTLGGILARKTSASFIEGDDYHPAKNIRKMAEGDPLDDEDREPWLADLNRILQGCCLRGESVVLACSALKESYRRQLGANLSCPLHLIWLHGCEKLLKERLECRAKEELHFMTAKLLPSQLSTLEIPARCLMLDIQESKEVLLEKILDHFDIS